MKNFTSFITAFSHFAFSLIISCDVGTFKTCSASDGLSDTADVVNLSLPTSLLGLDIFLLLCVVILLGVLTRNGAVIDLYAEANKPSFFGAASGVLVTFFCSTKSKLV